MEVIAAYFQRKIRAPDMTSSKASGGPRDGRRRTAVMADVAKLAGVSHQTVSRVVNDSAHVRPETRRRVMAAMGELDYRPNPAARALVTGRSRHARRRQLRHDALRPGLDALRIEQAAHAAGYFISIVSMLALDRTRCSARSSACASRASTAMLVITPQEGAADGAGQPAAGMPVVAVEAGRRTRCPLVAVDQFAGAVSATQLLLDLGHETVWHIAGPRDFLEAQQRVDGWRSTLEGAGAEAPPVLVGDWSPRSGYGLGQQLAENVDVTAIFVANDQMALGAAARAARARPRDPARGQRRRLRRHPRGAVLHPAADHRAPGLQRDGAQRLRLLLELMQSSGQPPQRVTIAPELVVRRSTGPPDGMTALAGGVARLGTETAFSVLARARELERAGRDIIHLEIGEPDFDTPTHISEAAFAALRAGETHYCPAAGIRELREAAAEYSRRRGRGGPARRGCSWPTGAKPFLFFTILATCEPGRRGRLPRPRLPDLRVGDLLGGRDARCRCRCGRSRLRFDVDDLAARLRPRTQLVILNSPQNPTGGIVDRRDGRRGRGADRRQPTRGCSRTRSTRGCIYDGAFASDRLASRGCSSGRSLLDGLSKTYAMTGWRCGFAAVPEPLVEPLTRFFVNSTSCVPPFVQLAGVAALTGPQDAVEAMVEEFRAPRARGRGGAERAARRLLPLAARAPSTSSRTSRDVPDLGADELATRLLEEAGVAVLAGSAFGDGRAPTTCGSRTPTRRRTWGGRWSGWGSFWRASSRPRCAGGGVWPGNEGGWAPALAVARQSAD